MQGSISKRERHKRKNSSRQKYEQMAVIFALLSGVLIFILLAQMSVRKKFQLSREAVIREAAAIELKKDPKNLSIDDYAKIKELKLSRKPLIGISLLEHFTNLEIVEAGLAEDFENHGEEGPHTHILRYICVSVGNNEKPR